MDKTTRQYTITSTIPHFINALSQNQWTILSPPAATPPPTPTDPPAPFYPLHGHPYVECVLPQTPAKLILADTTIPLKPRHLYFFMPYAPHAERPRHLRRDYHLTWFVFQAAAASAFTHHYHACTRTYTSPERFGITSPHAQAVTQLTAAPQLPPFYRADLQAHLIHLALEFHDNLHRPPQQTFQQHMVEQVLHFLDHHYTQPYSVADLAAMVRCTPNHLNTVFRRHTGTPIHRCLLDKRLNFARRLLQTEPIQIKEAAYRAGFTDPLYFSRAFRNKFGHPPSKE